MYGTACDRAQGIPTDLSRWLISLIITKLNRRVAGNSCSHRDHAPFPLPTPLNTPPLLHPLQDQHIGLIILKTKFQSSMFVCFCYALLHNWTRLLLPAAGSRITDETSKAVAAGHVRDEHAQYNNIPRGDRLSFCKTDTRTEGVGRTSAISRDNHVSWGAFCLQKKRKVSLFFIKIAFWEYDRLHLLFLTILARKPVKHVWHGRVSEILWQAIS